MNNRLWQPKTTRTELAEENGFCTLQVRAKRGSGTRDSERITATLGRGTLGAVEERRERVLAMVRDTIEDARTIQPDEGADGGNAGGSE